MKYENPHNTFSKSKRRHLCYLHFGQCSAACAVWSARPFTPQTSGSQQPNYSVMLHQSVQWPQQHLSSRKQNSSSARSSQGAACRWQGPRAAAEGCRRKQVRNAPTLQALPAPGRCSRCTPPPMQDCNRQRAATAAMRVSCLQASCRAVASVQEAATAPGTRDMSSSLTLANIRSTLIRQEDSIIFNFIERAQFAANPVVYQAGGVQVPGACCSGLPQLHGAWRQQQAFAGCVIAVEQSGCLNCTHLSSLCK